MGMPEKVHEALDAGSVLLNKLPYPDRPDNHFVVDPDKWDFYAMDTYRIVGEDDLAKRNAEEVIQRSVSSDGVVVAPMRFAEAHAAQPPQRRRGQGPPRSPGRRRGPGSPGLRAG